MKNLYESILDDIDVQMQQGNDLIKSYKKAEKDYIKLLNKTIHKVFGPFCEVSIKSPELAYALAGNLDAYKYVTSPKYNQSVDYVTLTYEIDDVISDKPVYTLQFNINSYTITGRKSFVIAVAKIPYTDIRPGTLDANNEITTKEIIKIISSMFLKKYKSLDDVVKAFKDNMFYEMKFN